MLFASCASESAEDDSDTASSVPVSTSADDQVASRETELSWSWVGTVIQDDGVTRACFGEVQMSEPPGCPSGMPIVDLDLSQSEWAKYYEFDMRTVAFAKIVGRPTLDGFVLEEPIAQSRAAPEPLECEQIETNRVVGETLSPQPAFDLLESRAAKQADVWFSGGGTFGAGGGIDATVLILDDSVRSWFRDQSVFDGFELTVCPQLRPT